MGGGGWGVDGQLALERNTGTPNSDYSSGDVSRVRMEPRPPRGLREGRELKRSASGLPVIIVGGVAIGRDEATVYV